MNMSNEPKPKVKKLLDKGWRTFLIVAGKESISKAGNPMIIFTIRDKETGYEEEIYPIATEGKRWFLKSILSAVGCKGGEDGFYNWEIDDVINHEFLGLVEHEPNEWINREGKTIYSTQHKITDAKEIVWNE